MEKALFNRSLKELGKASATEHMGKIMAAYGKAGMVCHNCHAANMPRVQQEYRRGDLYAIRVEVIPGILAVQLALTLLAKKLDDSQFFNKSIPSHPQ